MALETIRIWTEIIVALSGLLIGGIIIYASLKGRILEKKSELGNKADDRLITILQTTVNNLEKKVVDLTNQQQQNTLEIAKLRGENVLLREVLQGRDSFSQEYQKAGMEAIKRTEEILTISKDTNKNVEKLYQAIKRHLKYLQEKEVRET